MAEYSLRYCVWETTLACNLACRHCGSSAGLSRAGELNTAEALDLVDQLADLGLEELTMSGGEFLVRPDWRVILAHARARGLEVLVISNGLGVSRTVAAVFAQAGVASVSISIDGSPATHDGLRPVLPDPAMLSDPDEPVTSYAQIRAAVRNLAEAGVVAAAITQVSQRNIDELDALYRQLLTWGIGHWQVQLTHPMGRAKGHVPALDPADQPRLYDFVRRVQAEGRVACQAADDVGWFGSDEPKLRSTRERGDRFWTGCQAGRSIVGITSDGWVKGCLSMPDALREADLRRRTLREIWEDDALFAYNRQPDGNPLTGACADCAFGNICRGGCHSLAWTTVGHMGENPYCIRVCAP